MHLKASGWYLDCSRKFIPKMEAVLYNTLVSSALEVNELEKEPKENNPAPLSNDKDVASVKGKGKGRKIVPYASSQISIHSFTKASVQRTVGPATTVVGSPTATPFAYAPDLVAAPSHSGTTISLVPHKRKVVTFDISATSSERSSSLSLIENMDMEELIKDLMKTKIPPPAYCRIQEFLTKVCMPLSCFIYSFNPVPYSIFYFYFFWILAFQVGAGHTCLNTKPKVQTGIDLLFVDVPENFRVSGISLSSSDVPQWSKHSSTYFEVLFAIANTNLYDDDVIVFAHAADPDVSRSIYNWAHTEDFYVAEDWFGINDLDFQSPTNPSELVIPF